MYIDISAELLTLLSLSIAIISIIVAIFSYTKPQRWLLDDVRFHILDSQPEDWEYQEFGMSEPVRYVYKKNRKLTLQLHPSDRERDIDEDWVDNYPDPTALPRKLEVNFAGERYETTTILEVDGARYLLPMPSFRNHTISEYEHKIAKIAHCAPSDGMARNVQELKNDYQEALDTGGIKLDDEAD